MAFADHHADYGQRWGEGAARCFSIEGDFLDDGEGLRLMPVPDSFFCPISAAIMKDPVATVDGCAYEREYIERWFRERRQFRQPITSPTTGLELQSTTLMPLVALQRAVEAYLLHRPELKRDQLAGRSFEEAAQVLQIDLLEKQATNASVHNELYRLREANKALKRALQETEATCKKVMDDLERSRVRVRELEDESSDAMHESVRAINAVAAGTGRNRTDQCLPDSPQGSSSGENPLPVSVPEPSFHFNASAKRAPASKSSTEPSYRYPPSPKVSVPASDLYPPSAPRGNGKGGGHNQPPVPATGQEAAPQVESERQKDFKWQTFMNLKESLTANSRLQHLLQRALFAAILVLCLFLILRDLPGRKAVMDGGGLPWEHHRDIVISRQVEQLEYGTANERVVAALTLQKIAAEGDGSQATAIIEAGAAEVLVKLLEDDGVWVQEASASTLAALASCSAESQERREQHFAPARSVRSMLTAEVTVVKVLEFSVARCRKLGLGWRPSRRISKASRMCTSTGQPGRPVTGVHAIVFAYRQGSDRQGDQTALDPTGTKERLKRRKHYDDILRKTDESR